MALGPTAMIVSDTINKKNIDIQQAKDLSKNLSKRSTFLGGPSIKILSERRKNW